MSITAAVAAVGVAAATTTAATVTAAVIAVAQVVVAVAGVAMTVYSLVKESPEEEAQAKYQESLANNTVEADDSIPAEVSVDPIQATKTAAADPNQVPVLESSFQQNNFNQPTALNADTDLNLSSAGAEIEGVPQPTAPPQAQVDPLVPVGTQPTNGITDLNIDNKGLLSGLTIPAPDINQQGLLATNDPTASTDNPNITAIETKSAGLLSPKANNLQNVIQPVAAPVKPPTATQVWNPRNSRFETVVM